MSAFRAASKTVCPFFRLDLSAIYGQRDLTHFLESPLSLAFEIASQAAPALREPRSLHRTRDSPLRKLQTRRSPVGAGMAALPVPSRHVSSLFSFPLHSGHVRLSASASNSDPVAEHVLPFSSDPSTAAARVAARHRLDNGRRPDHEVARGKDTGRCVARVTGSTERVPARVA